MKYIIGVFIIWFSVATPRLTFGFDKGEIQKQISEIEKKKNLKQADYMTMGDLSLKIKDLDQAVIYFKKANNPQNDIALDKLAKIFHAQKNTLEEIRALELIHLDGKITPPQLIRLGSAYADNGKIKEAVDVFRESIKKIPKYEKAYDGLYDVFVKNNRPNDARLLLMEIINKFGAKKKWQNEYCHIDFEQGFFEDAKRICQQAISVDPQMADNHVYLAQSFKATGNDEQARKIIFKAAQQFKKSELTQWTAAQFSEDIENWEQAERQYDRCIEANPKAGRCFRQLGKVLFQLKKYDLALKALVKSCPYEKSVSLDIRKFSYDLEKIKEHKRAKKYMDETDKCDATWFDHNKQPDK